MTSAILLGYEGAKIRRGAIAEDSGLEVAAFIVRLEEGRRQERRWRCMLVSVHSIAPGLLACSTI